MASAAIQMSNQGSNVKSKTTNDLLDNGDLTVLIYNVSTGGTPIYNESFNNVINNGAWSLMLGSNTSHPLDLKYGTNYYIDYLINSENSNFSNNAGAYSNARLEFTSTYGNIASTNLVNNSLKINEDVTYYVQGDLGNDSNDGLSWATAKKTLGFLYSQDVNALPRQIEATVNIYINGTVLAPDTTRHTIIDYFYGSGLLNITGLPTIISVNNISAYDNSLTSKEGKVFINSTGSGWTVDEQKYKFVDFNYSYGTMPNDYYPIINNSADKLNIWYADKTITPTMNYSIVSMPQIKGATVDNPGSIINFDNYKYFDFVGNNLLMDIRNLDLTNAHSGDKPDMIYNNNEIQINNIVANGLLTNFNNWIETDHCLFDVGSSWVSIEESISRMKDTIILSDGSGYGVYINGFSTDFMVYRVRFSNNVQCINNGGSGTINFFLNNYFDKCDQGIIAPSAIINLGVFDIPTSNIRFVDSPIALELSGNKVLMGNNVNLISYNVGTEVKVDGKVNKTFDDLESQTPISNAKMGTFVNYMNSNTYIPYSNEEYDNSSSTLQAYTYQDAIDKLAEQQMWANDSNNNYIKTTYPQNVNFTGNLTLGDKITFRLGEIIDNIVDGWIKLTGNVNVEGNMNVSGYVVSEYIQIQANSTEMICNATYLGSIYYDGTLNNHYGCNGSGWNAFY